MMKIFWPELAMAIDSGNQPLVTVAKCVECALRAEYRLAQVKEERAKVYKAPKEERNQAKQPAENNRRFKGRGQNNQIVKINCNNNDNNQNNGQHNNNGSTKRGN